MLSDALSELRSFLWGKTSASASLYRYALVKHVNIQLDFKNDLVFHDDNRDDDDARFFSRRCRRAGGLFREPADDI